MRTRQLITLTGFAAVLVARAAHANQPVRGLVLDANTNAPVPGATVRVRGIPARAETDRDGRFTLLRIPEGTWTVDVSKPPMESTSDTVTVTAAGPPEEMQMVLIGEVEAISVVTVTKREAQAPGGTQLNRDEIEHVPGTRGDALTVVQSLPGIANTGTFTPLSTGIVMRGADPSDSRILVDGFEVPILYHFGAVQSILPTQMIQDMVYAPGAFGVEHGRSSAGILDVRTRPGAAALGGAAEISFINGSAFLQGPIGKHATFALSLRRSLVDAILPAVMPKDSGLSFTALPRYYDWQARFDWQASERWKLGLFVFGTDDGVQLLVDKPDAADPALSGNIGNHTRFVRAIASATYEAPGFTNRLGLSLDTTQFGFDVSTAHYLRDRGKGLTARDEAQWTVSPRFTLKAGAELMQQELSHDARMPPLQREGSPTMPNFTYDPSIERHASASPTTIGAWTALETKLWQRATLTTGLRYDGFLRNNAHLVQPRGELKFDLGGFTWRASGGLYSRPPYWQDEVVQANLKPERAWQAAFGFERELLPGLTLQTTGYYTRRSNLIVTSTDAGASGDDIYLNAGSGKNYGAEWLVTWRGRDHFAWLSYTISRAQRRDGPGQPERLFDFDQTHNLVLVASRHFGKDGRWQLGGRFQLTTGKPYTPVTGTVFNSERSYYLPVYGALNSQRMETMHQLDLRLDRVWQFQTWRLSAFIDVQNVYFHPSTVEYRYSADFATRKPVQTLPILPSFGVRGEF